MIYESATKTTLEDANMLTQEVQTMLPGTEVSGDSCPDPSLIVAYLSGDPEAVNNSSLELHLKTCPDCRLEFDALKYAVGRLYG